MDRRNSFGSLLVASALASFTCVAADINLTTPIYLDDRFELPAGFRIYRAAGPELCGGSYDLAFDGEGRLLVGDGTAVRRLIDRDGNGVFDGFEVIATGLGWRGPQGLLVDGDRLYAVGGDGLQLYEGYRSNGPLVHRGRLGDPIKTGGDHEAHTILRGLDGFLYLVTGDGAGQKDRSHINNENSPVLFAREASVFRISPDGKQWECLSTGGRNPPNLGVNFLGDMFSLDSDMEWHVDLPFYRPVTLNHWVVGGDQGWQQVGAYPRYYLDCLAGILEVGRGSPDWGVFYEHTQLPEKYRDAYWVCDYRWKMASADRYASTGRLLAFFLKRDGASWKASMETLARPRPGATDASGQVINFALIDIEVAPDGSIFLSDHNQGVWRIVYDPNKHFASGQAPPITPAWEPLSKEPAQLVEEILSLPQPASERSRLREEAIRNALGSEFENLIAKVARDVGSPLPRRLRAIRLLAPDFSRLPFELLKNLANDKAAEARGQSAWLLGIRRDPDGVPILAGLLIDRDAFVRRRAAEALGRFGSFIPTPELIDRLGDSDRVVRFAAMAALAHRPTVEWMEDALSRGHPQIRMRALVASRMRRDPIPDEITRRVLRLLLAKVGDAREDQLDLLRLLGRFQPVVEADSTLKESVRERLLAAFPDPDRAIRWEQIRLLGAYEVSPGFAKLLDQLESESDRVTQFHLAQAICKLGRGWSDAGERRLLQWILATQTGWFAELEGKGVEFPDFWMSALTDFALRHREVLLRDLALIQFKSLLGSVVIDLLAQAPEAEAKLTALYREQPDADAKVKFANAFQRIHSSSANRFLREEYLRGPEPRLRVSLLRAIAAQAPDRENLPLLLAGLRELDPDVVNPCARSLARLQPKLTEEMANLLVSQLSRRREAFHSVEAALVTLARARRPDFKPAEETSRRVEETVQRTASEFWKNWYAERFGQKFESVLKSAAPEKSNEELHRFILSATIPSSRRDSGAKIFERLQCHTCHGGGVTPGQEGRLFGPDLAGVTRRLSRIELADALVFPSKQVADRFKAVEVQLKEGEPLTGFITEESPEGVVLATREQAHRIPRAKVQSIKPQSASLMPERLLNGLNDEELLELLAFLDRLGATP